MSPTKSINSNQLQFSITSDVAIISSLPYRSILFPDPLALREDQNWLFIKPDKPHKVLVVFLMYGSEPIGCIGGFYNQPKRFVIASWAVQRNLLDNKLGQYLLKMLEKRLTEMGFSELEINYRSDLRSKSAVEHILAKYHWFQSQLRVIHFKMEVTEEKLPPWFRKIDRLVDAELFLWKQVKAKETSAIKKAVESGNIPCELSPFQSEDKIVDELSWGIRRNDRVAAWLVVHRFKEDLTSYTCLWTEPEYRRLGYGLLLIKTALSRQAEQGPEHLIFQVDPDNRAMLACLSNRLAELTASKVSWWTSAKRLQLPDKEL